MRICVCPGSYDPVTLGHLDVARRALGMFDRVVLAVMVNPAKRGSFEAADRVAMIEESVAERLDPDAGRRVQAASFAGRLLVDICAELGASAIVKGLRGGSDFAYELPMARMNKHLTGIETVFLPGDPSLEHVSSSLIKEVFAHGADVSDMVPSAVLSRLPALPSG
ncbi:MAG: pantetheine-phosphate adenylyltransferase [Micrococcales bacterium]|nr:MAG: pantetheine-phosphate adenylyltransferase [Micrococcales bacterium]PIE26710.1 MAG: pantetheine-phosphate adenylyltransferase [Micrococcales bacterium]